jgi:hypothetical protein
MIWIIGSVTVDGPATAAVEQAAQMYENDVDAVRFWAIDALQDWRGEQRLKVGISVAIGQEMAYIDKASHCREWLKDQSQPFELSLEAAARGLSHLQMAQLVVGQNNAWRAANDQIDAAYTAARNGIEAASNVAQIEAILAGLEAS